MTEVASSQPTSQLRSQRKLRKKTVANSYQGYNYDYTSERIFELAIPKESKAIWLTSFGPRVVWGTQDQLWPVPDSALKTNPTPRVVQLSLPKKNFQTGVKINRPQYMYSSGRPSVIWDVSPLAKKAEATERVTFLANSKQAPQEYYAKEDRPNFKYSCGRSSPLWEVSAGAQTCEDRPRTSYLARAKTPHPEFEDEKPIQSIVSASAKKAICTETLGNLAQPKSRTEGPFRDPRWMISRTTKTATASSRNLELSQAKANPEGYQFNRDDPEWSVPRSARRALASVRVNELATPIIRATMDHVQFDPDAFLVRETALKALCSRRVEELAQPILR